MLTRRLILGLLLALAPAFSQSPPTSQSGTRHLTILHSNDLHAHLIPDDMGRGGFAQLAAVVKQQRAHCEACLYLNAGDLVQGTPVSTFYQGVPVYQIANLLGIDAGTLGNHEFDYGWRRILEFAKIARYPLVSANVVDATGKPATGKPYTILNAGGIRVAVIGATLGDLVGKFTTVEQAGPWRVLPVVETVRRYAAEARDRADLIVVLGHIHDDDEVDAILRDVPDVSVVIAGHNHGAYQQLHNIDGRVAALVDGYGVELGRLDLEVDMTAKKLRSAEWKKIAIDSSPQYDSASRIGSLNKLTPDPDVARLTAKWEAKVTKRVDVPIGESKRRLTGLDLQRMIEQAMAEGTGSDIGFVNEGNLRDALPQGRILVRNILNILPFDNKVVMGTFKGSELPPSVTKGRNIDPDRQYTLVTSDFTAANQGDSDQLNATGLQFPRIGPLQRDVVIEWVKKKKVLE